MMTITERDRKDLLIDGEDLIIMVPHQMPPTVCRASEHPPITENCDIEDNLCEGDHDCHDSMRLVDALDYKGHQRHAVAAKVEYELEMLGIKYGAEPAEIRKFLLEARGY